MAHDFFQYYWLYKDFDLSRVIAPHNMRFIGAFFVFVGYKLNLYYNTATAFDHYAQHWGFLKQVYFNAVFINYLFVTFTASLISWFVLRKHGNRVLAFLAGIVFLLGFGTIFYLVMPLTDAFSVLLFTGMWILYERRSYWIMLILLLAVFQREYLLIAMAIVAGADLFGQRQRYVLLTVMGAVLGFVLYLILRKSLFYTPHLDFQSSLSFFGDSVLRLNFPLLAFLKQLAMTLNLFWLYLGIVIYKKLKGLSFNRSAIYSAVLLLALTVFICHIAGHGNNCGRYFYLISPLIILYLVEELSPLVSSPSGAISTNKE